MASAAAPPSVAAHAPPFAPEPPAEVGAEGSVGAPTQRQRSLFGEILDWMLVPLLLVWPVAIGITFLVAQAIATQPFDQGLQRRIAVVADWVRRAGPSLPDSSGEGSGSPPVSDLRMQLRAADGRVLAGDPQLPPPPDTAWPQDPATHLRDATVGEQGMRIAWRWVQPARGDAVLVQVAEGLRQRSALARNIVRGVILPQFVIVPISILLVWFGLGQGIIPLDELQARIRRRRPDDLSPIDQREAPEEIAPLVDSINGLFGRLEQSIHTRKRFIADAAHQLKTPLAGLRMQAELAQRQTDPEELRTSLRQIEVSVVRTTRMVNQLLALARAENQGALARRTAVLLDLCRPVREAVQELAPLALARSQELEFDAPEHALWVRGHAMLLQELAKNLLDNAIAYTPPRGRIVVRLRQLDEHVLLAVEDTGLGIAPAEREMVFRPFYRVLGTGQDGSGLGLCIVQEIARQHAAAVSLDDNPQCTDPAHPGLVVCVQLPWAAAPDASEQQPAA
ncbi:MAG: sensor histidine kinase N-terminal domain-containing protein [Betaproteobacteria bacterium]|nr:sensor histidine kinase N-terminal domain-containing protein [Betaproteobacteria bacterium]